MQRSFLIEPELSNDNVNALIINSERLAYQA